MTYSSFPLRGYSPAGDLRQGGAHVASSPAEIPNPANGRGMRAMRSHGVVIAGGGPTGLMLAAELALAKVDVAIVERRANQKIIGARAGGLQSRTIEVLDQRGIADRFLAEGQIAQVHGFAQSKL